MLRKKLLRRRYRVDKYSAHQEHASAALNTQITLWRAKISTSATWLLKRRKFIGILVTLVIALSVGVWYVANRGYFPASIRNQAKIKLYYPINIPQDLTVDRSSFNVPTAQTVTYTVNANNEPKYYVSIQTLPSNFDQSVFQKNFYQSGFFQTPVGNAMWGAVANQLVASIQTQDKKGFILINTTDLTAKDQLEALAKSLRQSK